MLSPFETAAILVQSLYLQGLRHAVISPGSRSTPLTLALAQHEGFRKKVVLDERSAAFIALGIGKETGLPAILVCTSGTAAANYFPAIVEAKQSGVPMVVLTADRPPHLRGIGSSQTIDQIKLYGDQAVFFHEIGEADNDDRDRKRVQFAAKQSVEESVQKGGAAHLNLPFRKPLEPTDELLKTVRAQNKQQVQHFLKAEPAATASLNLSTQVTDLINNSAKPLVIAGPSNRHHSNEIAALRIAEKIGVPVIAEPGSRFSTHSLRVHRYEQFLRNPESRASLRPDLILRFGDQPFTKSILTALEEWQDVSTVWFSSRNSWQDTEMSVDHIVQLRQEDVLNTDSIRKRKTNFYQRWQEADSKSESSLKLILNSEGALCDGHVFHHLPSSLDNEWNIMLSNSLPPRDAALFAKPGQNVIVNRGAAGIDGILSTAIGAAVSTGSPTCAVLGDLAFLHDSNALLSLNKVDSPFLIVVINNNGGNIFKMLPVFQQKETFSPYFETPQQASIEHLTIAHGIGYRAIKSRDELSRFTVDNIRPGNPLLIECVTDSEAGMAMRNGLWNS